MGLIKWRNLEEPEKGREYLVVATTGLRIPLWCPWRMWRFQGYTRGILTQLEHTQGCLAYSLRTTLRPLLGSTISVWHSFDALRRFQHEDPHRSAMEVLQSEAEGTFRYSHWKCRIDALPRAWEEVDARFTPSSDSS